MSKVVLLSINAKYVHSSLAVWFLAGGINKYATQNHDVKVIETAIKQDILTIAEQVVRQKPDVIGISAYIWNANKLPDLIRIFKKQLPKSVIVMGGPEASHNSEYWLSQGVNYVLAGEGERNLPALLDALTGIENSTISDEDSCAEIDPYSDAYFKALNGRIAYIEASRGCPFKCAYCLSGRSSTRFFDIETTKSQLLKLSKSGTQTIKFVDRTFNCNKERAYELIDFIIGMNSNCCFHFEVAADLFDDKTLSLLGTAPPGRIQIEAGLQSFYEPTLKAVSRETNLEKTEKNIKTILSNKNIHVHIDLIAGLPHETLLNFQDSFDRAYSLNAHTLQLGFLKLLHGSKLREQAEALGIIYSSNPPYEIISNQWLSQDDLKILKQTENALQHTYNKGRFLSTLDYVLSVSGLRSFALYLGLGENVSNHATPLTEYTGQIYKYLLNLPNINKNKLRDCIICDLLSVTKGKSMPYFLRSHGEPRKKAVKMAENLLGRVIDYDEAEVLSSGKCVCVDANIRDPITNLYKLHFLNF